MNGWKYTILMRNPDRPGLIPSEKFEYCAAGDSFGQLVGNLIEVIESETGAPMPADAMGEVAETALDAWINRLTGAPMFAQRREFSDPETDFDLWITQPEGRKS